MVFQWTTLNKKNYPSLQEYYDACYRADMVDVNSRDSRQLMYALMKLEELNDKVAGDIDVRRTASTIYPGVIKSIAEPTPEIKTKIEEAKIRLRKAIQQIADNRIKTPLYGSMLMKFDWSNLDQSGKKYPKLAHVYEPTEIEKFDNNTIRVMNQVNGQIINNEYVTVTEVTADNWQYIGEVTNKNFSGGILRIILFMMIYANMNLKEWNDFNRKLKGLIALTFPRGATDPEIAATKTAAGSVAQNNVVVLSEDMKALFQSLTDAKGSDSFKNIIERMEKSAEFTILGQASTTELPKNGGSRAAVDTLSKVSANIYVNDMKAIERLVNLLLLQDYQQNYESQAMVCPWEYVIQIPEEINRAEKMDFVTGLKENVIPIRKDDLYSFIGIPAPDDAPEVFFVTAGDNTGGF